MAYQQTGINLYHCVQLDKSIISIRRLVVPSDEVVGGTVAWKQLLWRAIQSRWKDHDDLYIQDALFLYKLSIATQHGHSYYSTKCASFSARLDPTKVFHKVLLKTNHAILDFCETRWHSCYHGDIVWEAKRNKPNSTLTTHGRIRRFHLGAGKDKETLPR